MKYFLIAGEASGDLHASQLIKAIKEKDGSAEFCFLGGDKMEENAGVKPVVHYRNMAYMGFIEVIKHLGEILSIMKRAKKALIDFAPDALILIDYPSFNLKMADFAKKNGIPTFYYISPKVWAWKEHRVKKIKQVIDEMYSILPFETQFYADRGYSVQYAGNPSVAEIDEALKTIPDFEQFCKKYGLESDKKIIALVPGSRKKEISNCLPEMLKAALKFPDYQLLIAGAPSIDEAYYEQVIKAEGSYTVPKIISGDTFALVRNADAALVTSGTATLETALLGTPQIACYRMSKSKIVYKLFELILKVKYVTLPNLIANSEVIPELLVHMCNAENIAAHLEPLLQDCPKRDNMLAGYVKIRKILGTDNCAEFAARGIITKLNNKK